MKGKEPHNYLNWESSVLTLIFKEDRGSTDTGQAAPAPRSDC